jgi:hypothetical protein
VQKARTLKPLSDEPLLKNFIGNCQDARSQILEIWNIITAFQQIYIVHVLAHNLSDLPVLLKNILSPLNENDVFMQGGVAPYMNVSSG